MKDVTHLPNEDHRQMVLRVWGDHFGSGSISEEEISLIIRIGFAISNKTEYIVNKAFESMQEKDSK